MTDRKWYTPAGFLCRTFAKLGLWFCDAQAAPIFFLLYGSIDLLGVKGTLKLLKGLTRNGKRKTERTKNAMPRVRE